MPVFAERIAAMGTENAFKIGEDVAKVQEPGVDVIRFTLGEPDFDTAAHINQAGIDAILAGNTHYTDPAGIKPLRNAVTAHIRKTRGLDVDPDQVIALTGAKPAIGFAMSSAARGRPICGCTPTRSTSTSLLTASTTSPLLRRRE